MQEMPVMELNSSNFDDALLKNKLMLVDFWAEWCGPCKSMHPIFSRMAKKYNHVRFARVNIDHSQNIAVKFNVQSIPTFIMFNDGKVVQQMVGAVGEPGIHMICKKFLSD
uniref:Thiol-disulfide isomerase (TrxA) n=1 Tax=uncultured marine thaumarchaeote KM3_45_E05 TaxID=1456156 RepID=A0A075H5N2_9ARCH|nr:thiol-disulfide isomerase (trxA) [uncultured marine thaumarchaeote KM3_45_E05]